MGTSAQGMQWLASAEHLKVPKMLNAIGGAAASCEVLIIFVTTEWSKSATLPSLNLKDTFGSLRSGLSLA